MVPTPGAHVKDESSRPLFLPIALGDLSDFLKRILDFEIYYIKGVNANKLFPNEVCNMLLEQVHISAGKLYA